MFHGMCGMQARRSKVKLGLIHLVNIVTLLDVPGLDSRCSEEQVDRVHLADDTWCKLRVTL